ncbi:MAG TPA: ABC transporter ATP-binding protein [Chloroflexota bacterium]|jgi:oligopeptide/dipeptide ABC transporter ATP-binding protein|nr:ABC transporter ATP-binding protein [Chloroflexota bacterium]
MSHERARSPQQERETLLRVEDLRTYFDTDAGQVKVLDGLSLSAPRGLITGIVGESGSGKSVTALSVVRLLKPPGRIASGVIEFKGRDLTRLSEREMRRVRGKEISMIFQNPRGSLNPVFTVGAVLQTVFKTHRGLKRHEIKPESLRILDQVGLPNPERILRRYPHELSGGMCQRVMIALALACNPDLLIADEPTTALDVTIQLQIIGLLAGLRDRLGLTQILITHNLGVIAELCDRVVVMYAGRMVEEADVTTVFASPRHPYTVGLNGARPRGEVGTDLVSIPGSVPDLRSPPTGCRFHPRCPLARDICREVEPQLEQIGNGHRVACHFWREVGQ